MMFLRKYQNSVEYLIWSPKDYHGNVIYGQKESIQHYRTTYAKLTDWTAFIDIDEFIVSTIPIKELVLAYDNQGSGKLVMFQKKFEDRFLNIGIPVTQILKCIDGIDTSQWAPKCFVKNGHLDPDVDTNWDIHTLPVINCETNIVSQEDLRFNHYNVNEKQLRWMKGFYRAKYDFKINSECSSIADHFKYTPNHSY